MVIAILILDNEALDSYIKLLVLIYPDDTILIADSEENLQKAIICMEKYSSTWKLIVNETKTNLMNFGKTKVKKHIKFIYNNVELELASRVLNVLIGKCRKLGLPIA